MRNVKAVPAEPGKSSSAWLKVRPLPVVLKNWALCKLARISPANANQFFYRLMGIKIGKNAQVMPSVEMDIFFPELISVGEGAVIGIDCFLACHEFNPVEFRYGPITIGKNALLGARSFVLPGVSIGDGAMVSAQTTVYKDIPPNVLAFGSPLVFKPLGKAVSSKNKK